MRSRNPSDSRLAVPVRAFGPPLELGVLCPGRIKKDREQLNAEDAFGRPGNKLALHQLQLIPAERNQLERPPQLFRQPMLDLCRAETPAHRIHLRFEA